MSIIFKPLLLLALTSLPHWVQASDFLPPSDAKRVITESEWMELISRRVSQRDAEIVALYANQGDVSAQVNLGLFYYHDHYGIGRNLEKSLFWFSKAAENNEETGLAMAASMHFYGEGTPINKGKALFYRKISAEKGFRDGLFELGRAHSESSRYGLPIDQEKATEFFKQAALIGLVRGKSKYGQRLYDGIGIAQDKCEGMKWLKQASDNNDKEAQFKLLTVKAQPCAPGDAPQASRP